LGHAGAPSVIEFESSKALLTLQGAPASQLAMLFNFGDAPADLGSEILEGKWEKKIDSSDLEWLGPGTNLPSKVVVSTQSPLTLRPRSFAVFQRTDSPSE
jgi:hypothetical protein